MGNECWIDVDVDVFEDSTHTRYVFDEDSEEEYLHRKNGRWMNNNRNEQNSLPHAQGNDVLLVVLN